jgi:glycosyltransferase involved in cell wall biosynthesis
VKVLFLNRVYPPADGATGQLLADLAAELAKLGWQVTVVTSAAGGATPWSQTAQGVRVERVGTLAFSRASHLRRALSYLSLYPAFLWRALRLPRADVVVTLTDPPLLLLLGPVLKWLKGSLLVHWAQDVYPELAEELGVLRKGGWFANLSRRLSTVALRQHDRILVVGRCMKARLAQRGLEAKAMQVVPNWAPGGQIQSVEHATNPFRGEHGLAGRFVVMYSGNFGLAHPFDAVLDAARRLEATRPEILFLLAGGGPRRPWVEEQVERLRLGNVRFLPVQPLERLSQSLGAADVHLASMMERLAGLVVPSKVYGILAAGRPCIFLGPRSSEAARIIEDHECGSVLSLAEGESLARCLSAWASDRERGQRAGRRAAEAAKCFSLAAAVHAFDETLRQVCAAAEAPASVIHENSKAAAAGSTRQQSAEGEAS